MSIYGAMFSGVSALNAQSQALGMISDNISNVNTIGYKATKPRFSTLVTQAASTENYSAGGVRSRPFQAIDVQGLLQASLSATDIAVSGDGFFVVNAAAVPTSTDPYAYTRAGSFTADANGNLRNTAGYFLQAWPTDVNGNVTVANTGILSGLETVNVSGIGGTATATTTLQVGANLPATAATGATQNVFARVFDSLGVNHDVNLAFQKIADITATNAVTFTSNIETADSPIAVNTTVTDRQGTSHTLTTTLTYSGSGQVWNVAGSSADGSVTLSGASIDLAGTPTSLTATVDWTTPTNVGNSTIALDFSGVTHNVGGTTTVADAATGTLLGSWQLTASTADGTTTGATTNVTFNGDGTLNSPGAHAFTIDWTTPATASDSTITLTLGTPGTADGITQFSSAYDVSFIGQNGVQFGSFSGVSIAEDGIVRALFDNGESRAIYKIPIGTFPNPNAMTAQTGNVYQETDASGQYLLNIAGVGSVGKVAASTLESSTVDIAEEFTNMIITQRAYSASAKVITTADDMLDELIRAKR